MEEDEDILSQPSPGSSPPSSPQSNGRITVTVAAVAPAPPQPLPPQNSLTLALPIQNPRTIPGSSGGGGREDCWSEDATSVLIDAWGERYLELSRGNLKQKHWKEVADIVGSSERYMKAPTDIQCKNRIDTVKKKYKIEKAKIASGNGPSKWPFFERLDRLIGNTGKIPSATPVVSTVAAAVYGNSGQKVPVGIPVGRPVRNYQLQAQQQQHTPSKVQYTPVGLPQIQNPHRIASSSNSSRSQRQQQSLRRPLPPVDSYSEPEDQLSPDSADSLPPETFDRRRKLPKMTFNSAANPRSGGEAARGGGGMQREKEKVGAWGNSVRELTRAMLNLAEAYEQAENLKLQQLVDLEKQRMKFAKDLELQRMKIMVKTQFDISQLSRDSSGGSRRAAAGGGDPESPDGGDGNFNNNHRISNSVSDNNGVNVDHTVIDSSN